MKNFSFQDLRGSNFQGANLEGASFIKASLIADLTGAILDNVKGLYTKEQEMRSAQRIRNVLTEDGNILDMSNWHTCKTAHCICGWECFLDKISLQKASTHHPTLCKYYFVYDEDLVYEAIKRVASGEESVYNEITL